MRGCAVLCAFAAGVLAAGLVVDAMGGRLPDVAPEVHTVERFFGSLAPSASAMATPSGPTSRATSTPAVRPPVLETPTPQAAATPEPACPLGTHWSPTYPCLATPAPLEPQGMDWLADTGDAAPLWEPYEGRDTAILAGGPSSGYCDEISSAFGCYEANRVTVPEASLTPVNGSWGPEGPTWTLDQCNWVIDTLYADEQLDAGEHTAYYDGWAATWGVDLGLAEGECVSSPVEPPSAAQATTAEDGFAQAEADHQAAYGGSSDVWNREWGDAYMALTQLFDQFSV
jgi:hypothetical protein